MSVYERLSVAGGAATGHARERAIDMLRATAALLVLLSHGPNLGGHDANALATAILGRLSVGVWIFFAVSGYLIAGPFLRALMTGNALPAPHRYAVRRAARILPAYWIALVAMLVLVSGSGVAHWWQLPAHAFLLQNLIPDESQKLYFVAWTLGYEAIFYVLVPVGAYVAWRFAHRHAVSPDRLAVGIFSLWLVTVGVSFALAFVSPFHTGVRVPGAVQVLMGAGALANFCPGMLVFVADAGADQGSRLTRAYLWLVRRPLLTVGAAVAMFAVTSMLPVFTDHLAFALGLALEGLASGLVLVAVLRGEWVRPIATVLGPVGLISYGVYLWHWVVLQVVLTHHGPLFTGHTAGATALNIAVLLAITLPLALASWLIVERPLLRFTTDWDRHRRTLANAVAEAAAAAKAPASLPGEPAG